MYELFLSYDISSIPTNATITEVKVDLQDYTVVGHPFVLGVLNGYAGSQGATLEAADYVTTFPSGNIIDWGSTKALDKIEASTTVKSLLQANLGKGHLQLRLQFPGTNGDAITDNITFAHPTLHITYVKP
jgi:hypothetical protein